MTKSDSLKVLLCLPFVNGQFLLRTALESIRSLWQSTVIIDNSREGLNPSEWPVEIIRPHTPLSLSQSLNFVFQRGLEAEVDAIGFMHHDAEAHEGTPERLLLEAKRFLDTKSPWGCLFTHYDTLCLFNPEAIRSVGGWDCVLPQYSADTDYYRRLTLAGFPTIETGLPVTHFNDASNTIKFDIERGFIQSVCGEFQVRYYERKWGGAPGKERFEHPFNWQLPERFLACLKGAKLTQLLAGAYETQEGTFLEHADARTYLAQLETIRWLVNLSCPKHVIETGTAKSYFGLILSCLVENTDLFTFDCDERAMKGVELLNEHQSTVRAHFTLGDTRQTLSAFEGKVDLAWVDGGHDYPVAISDIRNAMRLGAKWIAVDDVKHMPQVADAIHEALADNSHYRRVTNVYYPFDARGIAVLRKCGKQDAPHTA